LVDGTGVVGARVVGFTVGVGPASDAAQVSGEMATTTQKGVGIVVGFTVEVGPASDAAQVSCELATVTQKGVGITVGRGIGSVGAEGDVASRVGDAVTGAEDGVGTAVTGAKDEGIDVGGGEGGADVTTSTKVAAKVGLHTSSLSDPNSFTSTDDAPATT
jgi:hypothetical protein